MANNFWIATTSPGDYGTAGNFSDGVPDASDVVYFLNSNIDVGSGNLNQSAVALNGFYAFASYTGKIGISNLSSTPGTIGTYLQIDTPILNIGRKQIPLQPGASLRGSPRLMFDLGTAQACAVTIESTSMQSADPNLPPVRIIGVDAAHTLDLWEGMAGVAINRPDEVSTFSVLTCGRSAVSKAHLTLGSGVTVGTRVDVVGGKCLAFCAIPAINAYGGEMNHVGTGAVSGTVTVHPGATYIKNTTGTVAQITSKRGGRVVLAAGGTVTNMTYDDPADIAWNTSVTFTNPPVFTGKGKGAAGFGES